MSAVLEMPDVAGPPVPRLLTAADLDALPDCLPSGPVKYELHHGVLKIMAPPGFIHGLTQLRFGRSFAQKCEDTGLGMATGEVGLILGRNPDHVLGPDACFILNASLPVRLSKEGYLETIPELVVEVRSKNDTMAELQVKAAEYLRAGVRVVLVSDFATLRVIAYRDGQAPQVFGPGDELTVPDLLPGFAVPVRSLFL